MWASESADPAGYAYLGYSSLSDCYGSCRLGDTFEEEPPETLTDKDLAIVQQIGNGVHALRHVNRLWSQYLRIFYGVERGTHYLTKAERIQRIGLSSRSAAYSEIEKARKWVEGYVVAKLL